MDPVPFVPSAELLEVLERARRLGVLGPGPVLPHVHHAERFLAALVDLPSGALLLDLGSGAGLPGLVLAAARPDLDLVLLDSLERRTALLEEAVRTMGCGDRVRVVTARAEEFGRRPEWRGRVDAVTARSFGPPATVAECAAPLLRVGGVLVVSEPPDGPTRWPAAELDLLGLTVRPAAPAGIHCCVQTRPCPATYPRRVGLPAKRPLF